MQEICNYKKEILKKELQIEQKNAIKNGLNVLLLEELYIDNFSKRKSHKPILIKVAILSVLVFAVSVNLLSYFLSVRCLLPNNFFIWEASRPVANCSYCINVTKPIILWNLTRREFTDYMYSSKPIIVKYAIKHWRASNEFSYELFKGLFDHTSGSYDIFDEDCQFLNFESDLFTLKEVFSMPEARARNDPGEKAWYVGWGNCHPEILQTLRQYYDPPEFFPEDAEYPATENIFIGYETGAVMHLDYISRLMWQGQVKGNKKWSIAPVSECEHVCQKLEYDVEPGDIVLLDTRIWYHATRIPKGELSITVQSEYG